MKPELEIRYVDLDGKNLFYGNVGEPTSHLDHSGNPISVGDKIQFVYNCATYTGRVVQKEAKIYSIMGSYTHQKLTDINAAWAFINCKVAIIESWQSLVAGLIGENLCVQARGFLSPKPETSTHPFQLVKLAQMMLSEIDMFEPAKPTNELLYSLFGGSELAPCKHMAHRVDETLFGSHVKVWVPANGFHFYMFQDTPLAYLRIDETIGHGPSPWLDRVTHAFYFDDNLLTRFDRVLENISTPARPTPRASKINSVGIELAVTALTLKESN